MTLSARQKEAARKFQDSKIKKGNNNPGATSKTVHLRILLPSLWVVSRPICMTAKLGVSGIKGPDVGTETV